MARTKRLLLLTALAAAIAAPLAAQSFSEGFTFLKAVRERDGNTAERILSNPSSTAINIRDPGTGETALHILVRGRDANWLARVNLLHAFPQNDVAPGETATPGYNNLRAELSYTWRKAQPLPSELSEFTLGISGTNLLDDDMRNSASFNKDDVLLPGASVRVFASVKY